MCDEILSKILQWSNIENNSNLNAFRDVKHVNLSNLYSAGCQCYHAIEFFYIYKFVAILIFLVRVNYSLHVKST